MEVKNKIVYNSDVIIRSREEVATLCLFYDQILLPYCSNLNCEFVEFQKKTDNRYIVTTTYLGLVFTDMFGEEQSSDSEIQIWEKENEILFDEKVFQRLNTESQFKVELRSDLTEVLPVFFDLPNTLINHSTNKIFIRHGVIEHLFRQDLFIPGIFIANSNTSKREIFKAAEAKNIFRYLLPQISKLSSDDILILRQKVKDTREGFSMHLQKLSTQVEAGLTANAKFDEISREALNIIETTVIPDYREFCRQLAFERTSFGGKVLDTAGKILEIDVAPWTPKFWGQTFKALGSLVGLFSDKENAYRSNTEQAYRFMHSCESFFSK